MALDENRIQQLFGELDECSPSQFPSRRSLSRLLIATSNRDKISILTHNQAIRFATASVEMWERAVHSLIIATSLSSSSEIWACVSGYYSSHYSIRAFAHLFGYFGSYQRRLFTELTPWGSKYRCIPAPKAGKEHRFYWTVVKNLPQFKNEPIFTTNDDSIPVSDASHRGFASYADHLNRFVKFEALDSSRVRTKLVDLASTALEGEKMIEIPNRDRYPDLGTVLSIAYLRIYKYREYLDGLLSPPGRFWDRHRTPSWCTNLLSFPARRD